MGVGGADSTHGILFMNEMLLRLRTRDNSSFGFAPGDGAQAGDARHMRTTRMLSPASALLWSEGAVGVDFVLELGEKSFSRGGGEFAGIMPRVCDVGPDPATLGHLLRVERKGNQNRGSRRAHKNAPLLIP
jgi:hypothetical protein